MLRRFFLYLYANRRRRDVHPGPPGDQITTELADPIQTEAGDDLLTE
jgi:hypothetical protein